MDEYLFKLFEDNSEYYNKSSLDLQYAWRTVRKPLTEKEKDSFKIILPKKDTILNFKDD